MKLQQFLNTINQMVEDHPSLLDLDVVTSNDDEGNQFNIVYYEPSAGLYDSSEREFISEEQFEEWDLPKDTKPNAICIN